MIILGIDPGVNNGCALFIDGNLINLLTLSTLDLIKKMYSSSENRFNAIIIEDSRLQSHLFTDKKANTASRLKIARNVGQLDCICGIFQSLCLELGIDYIAISPKEKGKKLNADEFKKVTGWQGKSNQHERDSAMVAWKYRNMKK
jgi:hypothetical protein